LLALNASSVAGRVALRKRVDIDSLTGWRFGVELARTSKRAFD
jgi:hypothetical protein